MYKVCHLTSVHTPVDVRILYKEITSLARTEYEVCLVYLGEPVINSGKVKFISAGKKEKRVLRILKGVWCVFRKAISVRAELYHFHDPELLFVGFALKMMGKKVVYDVHEDVPRQVLGKYWIPKVFRRVVSIAVEFVENSVSVYFDAIITATPHIRNRFKVKCKEVVDINNYPVLEEFKMCCEKLKYNEKENFVCYAGGLSEQRGIFEMIRAVEKTDVKLLIAGDFSPHSLQLTAEHERGWDNVCYLGYLSRTEIALLYKKSKIGLAVLHPIPNYLESQPIKIFEYMAAGIPVIASGFPLWEKIVKDNQCGICVNPNNVNEISDAISWLIEHQEEAEEMGKNGVSAVCDKYCWEQEEKKLRDLYSKILT